MKLKTTAEHLVSLLAEHGVDYLFLNPGTDTAPVQEAVYTLAEAGLPAPKVLLSTFESVSLAAAHAYWNMTGRPQAVFVHVDAARGEVGFVEKGQRDFAQIDELERQRTIALRIQEHPFGDLGTDALGPVTPDDDGDARWAGQCYPARTSIVRARAKSRSVRPLASCEERRTLTLFHEIAISG